VDDGSAARAPIRHQLTATARIKLYRAGLSLHLSPLGARGVRNLLFSSAKYLARPTLNLVATPILLSYLGGTQYGLLMTVSAILGLGAIADFGILDSTVRYVSKYYSFGDEPAVVRTIRSAASVCAIVGLVGVGILAASASFIARYLLHIPSVEQHIA